MIDLSRELVLFSNQVAAKGCGDNHDAGRILGTYERLTTFLAGRGLPVYIHWWSFESNERTPSLNASSSSSRVCINS